MANRPILFSPEMVQAILAGKKSQTRRFNFSPDQGDTLWVREKWRDESVLFPDSSWRVPITGPWRVSYSSGEAMVLPACPDPDHLGAKPGKWRPSIHMPRWASRISLYVIDVRAQPLGDISDGDALAEGVEPMAGVSLRDRFVQLWEATYGPGSWMPNRVAWAITFSVREVKGG
jgi:hypothetical protein